MSQSKQPAPAPAWRDEAKRLAAVLESIGRRETERRQRQAAPDAGLRPLYRSAELTTFPSRWDTALEAARRDPAACIDRLHVREIGWFLYSMGDLEAMRDCAEAIERGSTRSYVDAAWDGIGVPGGGLWCA